MSAMHQQDTRWTGLPGTVATAGMAVALMLLASCSPSEEEISPDDLAAELEWQVEAGEGIEASIDCPAPMPPQEWHEVRCSATSDEGEFTVVAVATAVRDGQASVGYSIEP